jgi:hypothetical protein
VSFHSLSGTTGLAQRRELANFLRNFIGDLAYSPVSTFREVKSCLCVWTILMQMSHLVTRSQIFAFLLFTITASMFALRPLSSRMLPSSMRVRVPTRIALLQRLNSSPSRSVYYASRSDSRWCVLRHSLLWGFAHLYIESRSFNCM